jgi:hypothetical protein
MSRFVEVPLMFVSANRKTIYLQKSWTDGDVLQRGGIINFIEIYVRVDPRLLRVDILKLAHCVMMNYMYSMAYPRPRLRSQPQGR